MKGREPTHRQSDDMGRVNAQTVEHGQDVVAGEVLAVHFRVVWNVGRRISAGVERYASVTPGKMANLRFPASEIACELMDKDYRRALTGLLVEKFYAIVRSHQRHLILPVIAI